MRNWITRFLFLGLAALPSTAWAQYPGGYYYQPAYGPMYGPANVPVYPPPYQPYQPYQGGAIIEAPQSMRPALPIQPDGRAIYGQVAPTTMRPAGKTVYEQVAPPTTTTKPAAESVIRSQAVELPPAKAPSLVDAVPKSAPALTPEKTSVDDTASTPAPSGPVIPLIPSAPSAVKDDAARKPLFSALFPTGSQEVIPTSPAPMTPANCVDACEANKHCFVVFGDYLYWNVHGADVPYAQPFDGTIPGLSVPRGPVAVASPKFNSGFRVGGGVVFNDGNSGFFGTFTYFRSNRHSDTLAPDPFVLHNFLAFPNTATSAVDSLSASVDYHIQLYVADFDYKCALVNNEKLYLNWLAGIRYAHLDQNLSSNFFVTGATTVNSDINFDGIGPRLGLDGRYQICGGVYGYAQGIVDLLFGQFRGNYTETNVFTGLVGQTSINSNRVVPILELEMGLGWQSASGGFRVQAGYYVGSWFNTVTTSSFASSIGATNFTTNGNNFRDNITFDGLVLRFMFSY